MIGAKVLHPVLQFALIFVMGMVCGGFIVKLYDRSHEAQLLFARKLKCQTLAAKYAQENTSGPLITSVERTDYSCVRSSCVAEETKTLLNPNNEPFLMLGVVDVVSGQSLFAKECTQGDESCQAKANEERDKAFEKALTSAK
jgi:hypothetical protein